MLTTTTERFNRVSLSEKLAATKADTHQQLERYRLKDHSELKDQENRMGQMLFHTDLIRRIEKITHRRVWAEDSKNDHNVCGFYTSHKGVKKFICAFDKGPLPEFSHIITDERDLPIKEKRGWRTVLTRLLQAQVMTWPQVKYGFGEGDTHAASDRWNANTAQARTK
jgi:hypothetical protein